MSKAFNLVIKSSMLDSFHPNIVLCFPYMILYVLSN
nr:MAG TPA: hypothetical protein [Caudoviricetes sp.]